MRRTAAFVADALVVGLGVIVLAIIITGGTVVVIGGQRVSAMGVDNPLLALALIGVLRYAALPRVPLFGLERWPLSLLNERARVTVASVQRRIEGMGPRAAFAAIACVAVAATVVKASLAWAHPGFFSGDDVEVHEMSIGALWKAAWPIWDLRNALFPLGIVYPLQKLFALSGVADPSTLVFAGRLSVALISSVTILLLWRAGARMWPGAPGWGVAAALLFATSQLHIAFGSSELPRPVATVFVVGAFVLLLDARGARVVLAAALMGVAAALRFSEAVFLVPALLTLAVQRRWLSATILLAGTAAMALAIVGLTDALYWGEPFHSLKAAIDYTLVQRLSSRGYQNVLWYLVHVFDWLSPAVALLAVFAMIAAPRATDVWTWAPVIVLSLLPHKEARYVIPVVPFACLTAVRGLQHVLTAINSSEPNPQRMWRPVALLATVAIGLAHDSGHWRLPRSNADVEFAKQLAAMVPAESHLAVEQVWRLGGRVYLHPRDIVDLDPDRLPEPEYLWQTSPADAAIVLDSRTTTRYSLAEKLQARGYEKAALAIHGSRYELWKRAAR